MTMKKKILCTLALIGAMSTSAFADSTTVAIDGKVVENSNVVVEDGVTYIPVRPVAEALGLNVEWTAETKSVAISNGLFTLHLQLVKTAIQLQRQHLCL